MPTFRNFDVYLHAKKCVPFLTSSLIWICKDLQTCYFEYFENASYNAINVINDSITLQETLLPKLLKSTCRSLSCLPACKKSTSFLTYFLKHCKDNIVKLLFWELWKSLTIPIKIIVSICSKYSCLPACRRSTLLRYCREIANFLF